MTRRTLAVWLIIISSIVSFSVTLVASSGKTIPFDEVNHRLQTVLQELSRTAQARPLALSQLAQDRGITLAGEDTITVVAEPVSGNASRIDRTAVRALGGTIEATSKSLMRVRMPVSQLEAIANQVNGIAFIRLPYQPRPLAITSEGVALTGASDFHTAGYYGQGTKVAIIDLGFIGLATAQAAGELDNVVYTHDYTGDGLETYTEHGTGVAEIVADMAPQASLYLLMIGDSVDLQNATDYCITNGIDIINHSVGWYDTNYYDGTGIVANIANNAWDNGILWVNAAGNEASDGHWQGAFVDSDGDSYLDFGSGSDFVDGDAIDEGNRIYASAGDTIYIYMTWDDWTASDQDYDLHLYNSSGAIVASSADYQNGTQQPTETLVYNVASSGNYEIVIENYAAPAAPNIEFFAYADSGASLNQQYHHPESTIITPANSAKVLTAGAIYRGNWTTGPQEYFSSQGPTNASKYAVSITKPDVMGPDGTSSYTYGTFYGTSAASPHVAGAAALLLSEDPTRTANQLQAKLEGDAIDMGAGGKDNLYGSGRLNLVPIPAQDLVGYWRFNEGSGSTAGDSSGLGNDGTIHGASWTSGSPDGSTALSFDGVNDYVGVPDDSSLNPSNALTIEAWIKPGVLPGGQSVIVEKPYTAHAYPYYQYSLMTLSSDLKFVVMINGTFKSVRSSSTGLTVGSWYHVAGEYDGQYLKIYVNGVLKGSADVGGGTISSYNTELYMARHGNVTSEKFKGMIDEVKIHNRALDPSEFNLLPAGQTPPALVTDFNASDGEDAQSTLTWTNPSDTDLAQVAVQRKTGSYPANHTDGSTVYDNTSPTPGASINYTDTGLINGTTYYYAVFSRDTDNNWNDTVQAGSNADMGNPSTAGGPVGYWKFNEGSGSVAGDSSGLGNDGTIHGASWVSGSPDGSTALSFDGSSDYVQVPNSSSLNPTNALTIEAWIKPGALPSGQSVIVEKPYTAHVYPYYQCSLMTLSSDLKFVVTINGAFKSVRSSSTGLTVGNWYHVAGEYDGQYLKIYVNGALKGSANVGGGTISGYSTDLYMARHGNVTSEKFKGTIDEVKINNQALDPSEFNLLPAGATPPALVTDFNASDGEDAQSTLTWTNPSDTDLAEVLVKRKTGSYPTSHTDGVTVYDYTSPTPGASINYADTGLTNGTAYYYAVFSRDSDNNWNDTVQAGSNADTGTPSAAGGPVGYWRFNEESGSTASDSSGLGNDGTIQGASWVSGSPDGSTALSFDGVNDYVEVPHHSAYGGSSGITIEAWVNWEGTGDGYQRIVDKSYNHQYAFYVNPSTRYLGVALVTDTSSVDWWNTGITLPTNEWIHVAFTWDGVTNTLKLYVDGVEEADRALSGSSVADYNTPLLIGDRADGQRSFKGKIDEVRIHGRALDPGEFNLFPAGPIPPALVTNFSASDGEDSQSTLTWTNPIDTDLEQVVVQRKTGSYPTNHSDGTTVYDNTSPTPGAGINYTDTGLINGTTYYYAVFSKDTDNNWNDTVQAGSNADTGSPSTAGGAVGYWKFNEGSGSVAGDSSGLGNDGTIQGASWVSGSPDGSTALSFDGVNDYVEVPHHSAYGGSSGITIEAWVNWEGTGDGYQRIVDKSYNHQYAFYVNPSTRYLGVALVTDTSSVDWWNTGITLPTNEWMHVAFTWDGVTNTLKLYVDGVEEADRALSGSSVADYNTPLLIGDRADGQRSFKGKIDEVRIHNRGLDPAEFKSLPATRTSALKDIGSALSGNLVRPNPVREAPAVFQVEETGISNISIHIYDLSGRLIFGSGWQEGNTFEWQLQNDKGEFLANGVYLYIVYTRDISDTTRRSKAKKIVLLR